MGVKTQVSLQVPEGWHRRDIAEKPRLRLRRSAGVGLLLFQMTQDFSNDLLLGDEGDDAEGASTLTFQRVGLIDPLDELRPAFSESGAFFWRQLGFVLGFGVFRAAQRLKGEGFVLTSMADGSVSSGKMSAVAVWRGAGGGVLLIA